MATNPTHVLILRTYKADMTSHVGFVWPESDVAYRWIGGNAVKVAS